MNLSPTRRLHTLVNSEFLRSQSDEFKPYAEAFFLCLETFIGGVSYFHLKTFSKMLFCEGELYIFKEKYFFKKRKPLKKCHKKQEKSGNFSFLCFFWKSAKSFSPLMTLTVSGLTVLFVVFYFFWKGCFTKEGCIQKWVFQKFGNLLSPTRVRH